MSILQRLLFADFPAWDDPAQCDYHHVEVDLAACNGCKLCTLACPAGVLELRGEKGNKKVWVMADVRGCISCNNCHAICSNSAIKAVQHFSFSGFYRPEGLGEFQAPRTTF